MADWTTPFQWSFLDAGGKLLIRVQTQSAADDLAMILSQLGITWPKEITLVDNTHWSEFREETVWCYYPMEGQHGMIRRGRVPVIDSMSSHDDDRRCTFTGSIQPDDFSGPDGLSLF